MKSKILIPLLALGICYLMATPQKKIEKIKYAPTPTQAAPAQKTALELSPVKKAENSQSSTPAPVPWQTLSEARVAVNTALTTYSAHPGDTRFLMHLGRTLAKLNTLTRQEPRLREETVAIYKSCFSDQRLGNDIRALCLNHSKQFVSKEEQQYLAQNLDPKLLRLASKLNL
jgi:hypothetical protein